MALHKKSRFQDHISARRCSPCENQPLQDQNSAEDAPVIKFKHFRTIIGAEDAPCAKIQHVKTIFNTEDAPHAKIKH